MYGCAWVLFSDVFCASPPCKQAARWLASRPNQRYAIFLSMSTFVSPGTACRTSCLAPLRYPDYLTAVSILCLLAFSCRFSFDARLSLTPSVPDPSERMESIFFPLAVLGVTTAFAPQLMRIRPECAVTTAVDSFHPEIERRGHLMSIRPWRLLR